MSSIYIQEPPTEGKVLIHSSAGDFDIELWSKEAPKACRNFIQLCLEGYYNGSIFHRVVPGFIAQGGDPTGVGTGGESIYGKPFKDEFHTRLRFVRRGLVAMANAGPNDNSSQFFFTLGQCRELQNKHTIFGKVAGDTLYNLPRFEEGEFDKDDRPEFAHKIIKTEILKNPFNDIFPRLKIENEIPKNERKKKKGTKNFSLLSFGDEAFEDEEASVQADSALPNRGKSAHDIAKDPNLSKEILKIEEKSKEDVLKSIQEKLTKNESSKETKGDSSLDIKSPKEKSDHKEHERKHSHSKNSSSQRKDSTDHKSNREREKTSSDHKKRSHDKDEKENEQVNAESSHKENKDRSKSDSKKSRFEEKAQKKESHSKEQSEGDLKSPRERHSQRERKNSDHERRSSHGENNEKSSKQKDKYHSKRSSEASEQEGIKKLKTNDATLDEKDRSDDKMSSSDVKAEIKKLKRELTGKDEVKETPAADLVKSEDKVSMTVEEYHQVNEKYKDRKHEYETKGKERENQTLAYLKKFTKKFQTISSNENEDSEEVESSEKDINDDSWFKFRLAFDGSEPILAKDASTKDDHWYDINDPRNALNKRRREEGAKSLRKNK